jgi:hypothetical protein
MVTDASNGSGWTPEALKALIDERDIRYDQRFAASQEALRSALAEKAVSATRANRANSGDRFDISADGKIKARLAIAETEIIAIRNQQAEAVRAQKEAIALALANQKDAVAIALQTAERAVAKAEAAADKQYLEAQIGSLREAFSAQILAQKEATSAALMSAKEAINAALASAEKAIAKAELATDKRFDSVNEFRSQLADQQKMFATQSEVTLRFTAIEDKLSLLSVFQSEAKGKGAGLNAAWVYVLGAATLMATIVGFISLLTLSKPDDTQRIGRDMELERRFEPRRGVAPQ